MHLLVVVGVVVILEKVHVAVDDDVHHHRRDHQRQFQQETDAQKHGDRRQRQRGAVEISLQTDGLYVSVEYEKSRRTERQTNGRNFALFFALNPDATAVQIPGRLKFRVELHR